MIALFVPQIFGVNSMQVNNKMNEEMKHYKHKMTPRNEDFLDNAPMRATDSIVINASTSEVWNTLDNTQGFVQWFPGVVWAKMEIESEKGNGAKRLAKLNSYEYYEEMIAVKQNESWGITMLESTTGLFESITEVVYLEEIDSNTTTVIFRGGYQPKGFGKLLKRMMTKSTIKIWRNALLGLKEYVEQPHKD
ncbi:MAG: SRPBCC family protein [Bacteroidia bacterium]